MNDCLDGAPTYMRPLLAAFLRPEIKKAFLAYAKRVARAEDPDPSAAIAANTSTSSTGTPGAATMAKSKRLHPPRRVTLAVPPAAQVKSTVGRTERENAAASQVGIGGTNAPVADIARTIEEGAEERRKAAFGDIPPRTSAVGVSRCSEARRGGSGSKRGSKEMKWRLHGGDPVVNLTIGAQTNQPIDSSSRRLHSVLEMSKEGGLSGGVAETDRSMVGDRDKAATVRAPAQVAYERISILKEEEVRLDVRSVRDKIHTTVAG